MKSDEIISPIEGDIKTKCMKTLLLMIKENPSSLRYLNHVRSLILRIKKQYDWPELDKLYDYATKQEKEISDKELFLFDLDG